MLGKSGQHVHEEAHMPRKTPGAGVRDKKLYEDLRDLGNSKDKSARIANAAANTALRNPS